MLTVIKGGIIGGAVSFIWMWISWTALSWHQWAIERFAHEDFIGWVIQENAQTSGVYTIPHMGGQAEPIEDGEKAPNTKPFIYLQINRDGIQLSNLRLYLVSFLVPFLGAAIATFFLLRLRNIHSFWNRFSTLFLFGIVVTIFAIVPSWNWFGIGGKYAFVALADLLISWTLIAIALGIAISPKPPPLELAENREDLL